MVKATFTLDEQTMATLRQAAGRLNRPNSQVVRDAIREYADRIGRLSERERLHMLSALDAIMARPPTRSRAAVEGELRELRASRKRGGRRHRV